MVGRTRIKKYRYADVVLEHLPVGVAVYDLQEFRLLEANTLFLTNAQAFLEPCWHDAKVLGHPLAEFGSRLDPLCSIEMFLSVVESGKACRGEALPLSTQQGSLTYWDWTLDVIEGQDGVRHLLQTITDVTNQELVRQQTIQSWLDVQRAGDEVERERLKVADHVPGQTRQSYLRTVLDQLPQGILMADTISGLVTYANPAAAQLLMIPLSHLVGSPVHKFTHVPDETTADEHPTSPWNFFLIQALSGETVRSKEAVMVLADGSKVTMLISGAPLYTTFEGQSAMTGAVIVFQDITAQKSIEQHKSEFVWIANHELRTPITIIQGFAELLKMMEAEGNPLNEFTRNALTHIIDQSEHLARLIEAMLDISKIEQEQFELDPAPNDLLALLTSIVKGQEMTARHHHFRLALHSLGEQDRVIGLFDRQRMTQVISNLLNNAVKYSPDGGEIEVGLRVVEDEQPGVYREALIHIKDHGIGIAPADLPHVFKRFYRAGTLEGYLSGFGIGLYVVKEVITRHGGRIWVESVKGSGSTFYVWLPLKAEQA